MEELLKWHADYSGDKSHIFLAKERCAAGILEAMAHFELQPNVSPRDQARSVDSSAKEEVVVAHEVVKFLLMMEKWLKADVENNDDVFSRLKSSLVCLCFHRTSPLYSFSFIKISSPLTLKRQLGTVYSGRYLTL